MELSRTLATDWRAVVRLDIAVGCSRPPGKRSAPDVRVGASRLCEVGGPLFSVLAAKVAVGASLFDRGQRMTIEVVVTGSM